MTDIVDSKVIQTELEKVGIHIDSIYDLVNTSESYTEAIPILIDLVQKEFPNKRIQEGIVRALTIKEAKGKAPKHYYPFIRIFQINVHRVQHGRSGMHSL